MDQVRQITVISLKQMKVMAVLKLQFLPETITLLILNPENSINRPVKVLGKWQSIIKRAQQNHLLNLRRKDTQCAETVRKGRRINIYIQGMINQLSIAK